MQPWQQSRFWWSMATVALMAGFTAAAPPKPRMVDGRPMISLVELARHYGMRLENPSGSLYRMHSAWSDVRVDTTTRRALINGVTVWLHEAPRLDGGRPYLEQADATMLLGPILRKQDYAGRHPVRVVVLDPGHGGRDPGAIGSRKLQEKEVVLDVALRTRTLLRQAGLTVHLTRDRDIEVSLADRVAFAAAKKADLFVSIHLNAAANAQSHGVESYVLTAPGFASTNSPQRQHVTPRREAGNRFDGVSTVAAYSIQKSLVEGMRAEDRGLRGARFQVLKDAPCPAVLTELAFLSHRQTEQELRDDATRARLAAALARGILNHARVSVSAHLATP